jgi:Tfp pilus assembly protein PilF/peroxiredoxin
VGNYQGPIEATVRWPSGLTETFRGLPVNHHIELVEGSPTFQAKPFASAPQAWAHPGDPNPSEALPSSVATWLVEPVKAPDFSLPDLAGNLRDLKSFRDRFVLLNFWTGNAECFEQLRRFGAAQSRPPARGLHIVAVNVDNPGDPTAVQTRLGKENPPFPILLASREVAGIYNVIYRYMFDRHRDLPLPASFLIDDAGRIVKVYQGIIGLEQLEQDLADVPRTAEQRFQKALPFPGTLFQDTFQRNSFTYGIAFFQHGFLDQAAESFKQVIANRPDDAEAYYNLGTLCLRRHDLAESQQYLEHAVKLRPNYADAWNNLGTFAAQKGNNAKAIENFQRSLALRPTYATALLNLGNVYRKQGNFGESENLLKRALDVEPKNAEISYSLGMLYVRTNRHEQALASLEEAIRLRPNYPDALNNIGVLLVQQQRYADAEKHFEACIEQAPDFDQAYLNLARLYLIQNQKGLARTVLQSLLQKQPNHQIAQQMLQMLY